MRVILNTDVFVGTTRNITSEAVISRFADTGSTHIRARIGRGHDPDDYFVCKGTIVKTFEMDPEVAPTYSLYLE